MIEKGFTYTLIAKKLKSTSNNGFKLFENFELNLLA